MRDFKEWLQCRQAKESFRVPAHVLQRVGDDVNLVLGDSPHNDHTYATVTYILKEVARHTGDEAFLKAVPHVPKIVFLLSGRPPRQFTKEQEAQLIADVEKRQGVAIDYTKIATAKL
jgi:hypothetical protein